MKQGNQKIKYCLYARKSSESDERQAMSIDSQLKEMQEMATREDLDIVTIKRESYSAKNSGRRPVFMEIINEIKDGKYNGILTWAPDRLSRNAGDLGSLVDLMDNEKLTEIRTHSQKFRNNPNEKFLLMILCSQAKLENDNRAVNVKRGIRAKCERGWRPCMPPLGYINQAATADERHTVVDKERAPYMSKMFEMSANGKSGRHIKQWLIDNDVKTRKDKTISLSMVYNMLKNTFYYGEFEYPKESGNWYQGKHEPLVSKELFDEVQKQLKVPIKSKWGAKEFPFRQFLKCGRCGSTIVGEEKFKKLKSGKRKRHVYYHCSRQVDYDCDEPYVKEKDIVNGLSMICNKLISNTDSLEPGLRKSIDKFKKMAKIYNPDSRNDKLLNDYTKYALTNGTDFEKTRLVRNLSIKLVLKDKKIVQT